MSFMNELKQGTTQMTCEIRLQGDQARNKLISHFLSSNLCHNMIRMSPTDFLGYVMC